MLSEWKHGRNSEMTVFIKTAIAALAVGVTIGAPATAGGKPYVDPCGSEAPTRYAQVCVDAFLALAHGFGLSTRDGDAQLLADGKLACHYGDLYPDLTGTEEDTLLVPAMQRLDPNLTGTSTHKPASDLANAAAYALCTA
jgi:hypothetical protein